MPFTPFHFGPALFFGTVLRINIPTILIASVVLDAEPLLVLIFNLNMPLHGFFHTFLGSSFIAAVLSVFMKNLLKNEKASKIAASSFLGVYLHIIFDSPLYMDIKPFYPLNSNPFYGIASMSSIYILCVLFFAAGVLLYLYKLRTSKL